MKLNDLDRELRNYEQTTSRPVPLGQQIVARLDGRGFTRLTKKDLDFETPFDPRFHLAMVETARHLMGCGFRIPYAYTQSDEISLFIHPEEEAFDRQVAKYISILSGEASACFSLQLGMVAVFDCRISELPSKEKVLDYFRWRQEDSRRNALNAHCFWALRKDGRSAQQAERELRSRTTEGKRQLLLDHGIVFDELPTWQRTGVGLYWESYTKEGKDPRTGKTALAERRRIRVVKDLPVGRAYGEEVERWTESPT